MRRRPSIVLTLLTFAGLLAGCASAPPVDGTAAAAAEEQVESQSAQAEPKVVQTTAQAEKYLTEDEIKQAYRECMRKMRRITGSRIPRNACQGSAGLYGGAYNQVQEGAGRGAPGAGAPGE